MVVTAETSSILKTTFLSLQVQCHSYLAIQRRVFQESISVGHAFSINHIDFTVTSNFSKIAFVVSSLSVLSISQNLPFWIPCPHPPNWTAGFVGYLNSCFPGISLTV